MVGAVETLTVTAERLVQPTSAVRNLIQQVAVRELPLLTRTFVQLVTLVPGVSSDLREEACFCDQGNLNISDQRGTPQRGQLAAGWRLQCQRLEQLHAGDHAFTGSDPGDQRDHEQLHGRMGPERRGRRQCGDESQARTGSREARTTFCATIALNANSFFRNMDPRAEINGAPPRLRYNNFGYTLGGPALPGRKKLFFFFSQEMATEHARQKTRCRAVPDPTWLTDPASPNYVPPEARDPNAVKLLTLWPAPNVPGTNLYRDPSLTSSTPARSSCERTTTSNTNWSLTGRYLHDQRRLARRVRDARLDARSSLSGRPPRCRGGPARRRSLLPANSRTSCRPTSFSRKDGHAHQGRPRDS